MGNTRTQITILIPCKDPEPSFFKESLNSVFNQTNPNWKLVIIDDHSKEQDVLDILNGLINTDNNRISVIKNESNMVTGALNTGMRYCDTPYVCSLHCDDMLAETAIGILQDYIKEYPDTYYFHSSRLYIDDKGYPVGKLREAKFLFTLDDFKHTGPVKHLHCWKVEAALAIGGMDEQLGLHGADDYDFPWCMAEAGYKFKAVADCLYYYRDHRTHHRLTTHVPLNTQIDELKKIWKKHGLTDKEIEQEIKSRKERYLLRDALFIDENDKRMKEQKISN